MHTAPQCTGERIRKRKKTHTNTQHNTHIIASMVLEIIYMYIFLSHVHVYTQYMCCVVNLGDYGSILKCMFISYGGGELLTVHNLADQTLTEESLV